MLFIEFHNPALISLYDYTVICRDRKKDSRRRQSLTPSPTTLDEVLLKEPPLSASRPKRASISNRYEKYDINVIGIHNKGKNKR